MTIPLPTAPITLSIMQRAAIAAIRQEPQYRFVGSERRIAESLVKKGALVSIGGNRYTVTPLGEISFGVLK